MSDNSNTFFNNLSVKNPLARIIYSSAPIAGLFIIELSKHLADSDPKKTLISSLTTAGIIAAPVAGVAANVLAEAISQKFFKRFTRKDILENGDLQRAVGDTICATVLAVYDEQQNIFKQNQSGLFQKLKVYFQKEIHLEAEGLSLNKSVLRQLSKLPAEAWTELLAELEKDKDDEFNLTVEELQKLYPKNLPDILAIPAARFNEATALDKNVWGKILRKLCRLQGISSDNEKNPHFTDTIAYLAESLEQNFPDLLKHTLITNVTQDGKAYANLQLKIMGEVLFYVRENNKKLGAANEKLDEIGTGINRLSALLGTKFTADSAEFDEEFDEIRNLLVQNGQIIIQAIKNLEQKIDGLIEGQADSKKRDEKLQEGVDYLVQRANLFEPKPKEIFKGRNLAFPNDTPFFTSREDVLIKLKDTLENHKQASFYGTHGLGKTRTAIEYVNRYEKNYSFTLFISATKGNFENNAVIIAGDLSEEIKQSIAEIRKLSEAKKKKLAEEGELSEAKKEPQTLKDEFELFLKYLKTYEGNEKDQKKWLIICDNVEDISEVKGKIPRHLNGHVIYTSNLRDINEVASLVPIERMSQSDAGLVLVRRKMNDYENKIQLEDIADEEREFITKIVEKIGTLPLALNLAGACICKNQLSFREYYEDYEEYQETFLKDFSLADYYEEEFLKGIDEKKKAEYKGIAGVFMLSYYRIIKAKDKTPEQQLISEVIKSILNLSVFLAPDDIPEEILQKGLIAVDENFKSIVEKKRKWVQATSRLTHAAFFIRDPEQKTYITHRLILMILQKQLNKEEKLRFNKVVVDVLADLWISSDFSNRDNCRRLLKHAETGLNYTETLEHNFQSAPQLCNKIAMLFDSQSEYDKAFPYFRKAVVRQEQITGKKNADYAIYSNNLAQNYEIRGHYDEAIERYKDVIKIEEQLSDRDNNKYASHLSNLGLVYQKKGNYAQALNLHKRAWEITEKAVGIYNKSYATRLNNLAGVYSALGKNSEALELHGLQIVILEEILSFPHPKIATAYNNMGATFSELGDSESATYYYRKANSIFAQTVGKEHVDYAVSLNNVAFVYISQKKFSEAIPLLEESIRILESKFSPNHPEVKKIKANLLETTFKSQQQSVKKRFFTEISGFFVLLFIVLIIIYLIL